MASSRGSSGSGARSSPRRRSPLVIVGAFVFPALFTLVAACGGDGPSECVAPEGASYTVVSVTTDDDVTLCGRRFGNGEVGVVLAHMFPADQESWREFAEVVAEEGHTALTFNFRGYKPSGGEMEISKIDRDVEAVLRYLCDSGVSGVFLFGASMGGTASVKVAARQDVLGVATLSAPTEFRGLEALAEVGQVTAPKLFIAAEDDGDAQKSAAAYFDAAVQPRLLEIYAGNEHGTRLLEGRHATNVRERLLEFLEVFTP